jgi:hypothetical protein
MYIMSMFWMVILLVIIIAGIIGVLLLRIRVRYEYNQDRHVLFTGLGRTGQETDFRYNLSRIKLAGLTVRQFDLKLEIREFRTVRIAKQAWRGLSSKARVSLDNILPVIRRSLSPLQRYTIDIMNNVCIEELHGRIEAGFTEPDLTGMTYGFYQALLGAAPGVTRRFEFVPVWMGASFQGEFKAVVALPLYMLVWRSLQLLWRLPLREFIRFTIRSKRKGDSDVEQRRGHTQERGRRAA